MTGERRLKAITRRLRGERRLSAEDRAHIAWARALNRPAPAQDSKAADAADRVWTP